RCCARRLGDPAQGGVVRSPSIFTRLCEMGRFGLCLLARAVGSACSLRPPRGRRRYCIRTIPPDRVKDRRRRGTSPTAAPLAVIEHHLRAERRRPEGNGSVRSVPLLWPSQAQSLLG